MRRYTPCAAYIEGLVTAERQFLVSPEEAVTTWKLAAEARGNSGDLGVSGDRI